nr:uncharacterized protein LOC109734142 [Aegilops tauschii subsp. strangulata]
MRHRLPPRTASGRHHVCPPAPPRDKPLPRGRLAAQTSPRRPSWASVSSHGGSSPVHKQGQLRMDETQKMVVIGLGTGCLCVVRLGRPCAGDEHDGRALTCIACPNCAGHASSLTHGHAKAVLLRQAPLSPEHSVVHDGLLPPVPSARMMSFFAKQKVM